MHCTKACHSFTLAVALFTAGACREPGGPQPEADLSVPGEDMASQVTRDSTIRELNSGALPDNSMVRVTGVVTSPRTWANANNGNCEYSLYIAQPDPAPSLKDGMLVYYTKKESGGDMALSATRCIEVGKDLPINTMMAGRKVEVTGRFNLSTTGYRQIYAFNGAGLKDLGPGDEVAPVVVAPKDLVNGNADAFKAAQGALVRMNDVTTSELKTPFEFKVAATGDAMKASVSTSYLRVANKMYMPPADGTQLKSVTGIVVTDFKGYLWPRSEADIAK